MSRVIEHQPLGVVPCTTMDAGRLSLVPVPSAKRVGCCAQDIHADGPYVHTAGDANSRTKGEHALRLAGEGVAAWPIKPGRADRAVCISSSQPLKLLGAP